MLANVSSFELLNFPVIPERSRLFHLEPMGVGTANVECLYSYVCRLTNAHLIDFDFLMDKEIRPRMGKCCRSHKFFFGSSVLNTSWLMEGIASHYHRLEMGDAGKKWHRVVSKSFIQVLEDLTLRQNLVQLTAIPLELIAPVSGLVRSKLAWCPTCLEEWQQEGSSIYFPLLWSIKHVVVCPKHKELLRERCPSCRSKQPLLPSIHGLGYCFDCGEWLAGNDDGVSPHYRHQELDLKSHLNQHLWEANSIGGLLVAVSQSKKIGPKSGIKKRVLKNIKELHVSRYQLSRKISQEKRLSLDGLLKMSYGTKVSLCELVCELTH